MKDFYIVGNGVKPKKLQELKQAKTAEKLYEICGLTLPQDILSSKMVDITTYQSALALAKSISLTHNLIVPITKVRAQFPQPHQFGGTVLRNEISHYTQVSLVHYMHDEPFHSASFAGYSIGYTNPLKILGSFLARLYESCMRRSATPLARARSQVEQPAVAPSVPMTPLYLQMQKHGGVPGPVALQPIDKGSQHKVRTLPGARK